MSGSACPTCGGTGRRQIERSKPCKKCGGTGWWQDNPSTPAALSYTLGQRHECDHNGRERWNLERITVACDVCLGTGKAGYNGPPPPGYRFMEEI